MAKEKTLQSYDSDIKVAFITEIASYPRNGQNLQVGINLPFIIRKEEDTWHYRDEKGTRKTTNPNLWYSKIDELRADPILLHCAKNPKRKLQIKGFKTPEEAIRYCSEYYIECLKSRIKGVESAFLNITGDQIRELQKRKTKTDGKGKR